MAFKLTKVTAPIWSGSTGDTFEVEVKPGTGGGPFLVHSICYGTSCLVAPPFQFTVLAGDKGLTAVYDWDNEGEFVELREIAGGQNQVLRKRRYQDKEPFQAILVRGK